MRRDGNSEYRELNLTTTMEHYKNDNKGDETILGSIVVSCEFRLSPENNKAIRANNSRCESHGKSNQSPFNA